MYASSVVIPLAQYHLHEADSCCLVLARSLGTCAVSVVCVKRVGHDNLGKTSSTVAAFFTTRLICSVAVLHRASERKLCKGLLDSES